MIYRPGETDSDAIKAALKLTPREQDTLERTRHTIKDLHDRTETEIKAASELTPRELETLENTRNSVKDLHDRTAAHESEEQAKAYKISPETQDKMQRILTLLKPYLLLKYSQISENPRIISKTIDKYTIVQIADEIFLQTYLGRRYLYQKIQGINAEELLNKIEQEFPGEIFPEEK
ncbi:MAG: hypothetical protein WC070_01100 [Candidatus Magasanikbacteria bacterium]